MRSEYRPGLSENPDSRTSVPPALYLVGLLFLVVVGLVYVFGHTALLAVPAMATAHAIAMVAVYATTGALLLTYASAAGERGYLVAVDDFGSGFSNLSSLSRLQPSIVKIDRGVVVQAGLGDPGGLVTLAAAVDIARALGARVLAEGLETNDEADACVRLDVDLGQGYRFARSLDEGGLLTFHAGRAIPTPPHSIGGGISPGTMPSEDPRDSSATTIPASTSIPPAS